MRNTFVYSLIAIFGCLLFACSEPKEPTRITLSHTVITLEVGQDTVIEATVTPQAKAVVWTSEMPEVATVVAGIVTAIGEGVTTITASADEAKATCTVVVNKSEDPQPIDDNLSDALRYLPRSSKRGVGFASPFYPEDVALLANAISWGYNWGPNPSSSIAEQMDAYEVDFCPMAWNANYNKDRIRAWKEAHPNCRYLLAYNEPNLNDQARMTPQEAAATWPELKAFAQEIGMLLVAPAMNYGTLPGYSDPIKWLDEFFACDEVSLDDVAALALHCYMGSAGAMKGFIDRFDKYNKPIWMTEFCGWEAPVNNADDQLKYMSETVLMLESDARVERYAWFLARGSGSIDNKPWNQLLTKTDPSVLSSQGLIYEGLSTFDRSVWLNPKKHVLMNTCCSVGTISSPTPVNAPHFLPANDAWRTLYMGAFISGKWVEYQLDAPEACSTIRIHAMAYMGSQIAMSINGTEVTTITIPRSADEQWATFEFPLNLPQGKHTLRMEVKTGNCNIHWFQFK